jgi:hypothetical protein
MFILLASSLSLIYNDFNFERIPHRRPFTVCSRYIRTRILIGFGGIRTHDILTPFKDWLRARRSAWLSYEPSETIHQLEIFKSKHLYGTVYQISISLETYNLNEVGQYITTLSPIALTN